MKQIYIYDVYNTNMIFIRYKKINNNFNYTKYLFVNFPIKNKKQTKKRINA